VKRPPPDLARLEKLAGAKSDPLSLIAVLVCRDACTVGDRDGGWTFELMALVIGYSPLTKPVKTPEARWHRYAARIFGSVLKLRRPTRDQVAQELAHHEHMRAQMLSYFEKPHDGPH